MSETPTPLTRYRCTTQLERETWIIRVVGADEPEHEDDLASKPEADQRLAEMQNLADGYKSEQLGLLVEIERLEAEKAALARRYKNDKGLLNALRSEVQRHAPRFEMSDVDVVRHLAAQLAALREALNALVVKFRSVDCHDCSMMADEVAALRATEPAAPSPAGGGLV